MSKENTEKKNNGKKQHMTQEELAQLMGLSVPTTKTTTSTQEVPLHKEIKNRLNEVMHETLCKEFGQYYFEIDKTMVQHSHPNKKDDEPRKVVKEKEKVVVDEYSQNALNEMASALKQDANNILQLPEGVDIDKESIWKNKFWYGIVVAGISMVLTSMGMQMRSLVASLGIGAAIPNIIENIIKGVSNSLKEGLSLIHI